MIGDVDADTDKGSLSPRCSVSHNIVLAVSAILDLLVCNYEYASATRITFVRDKCLNATP